MMQVNGGIGSSIHHQGSANNMNSSGGGSMGNMTQGISNTATNINSQNTQATAGYN